MKENGTGEIPVCPRSGEAVGRLFPWVFQAILDFGVQCKYFIRKVKVLNTLFAENTQGLSNSAH